MSTAPTTPEKISCDEFVADLAFERVEMLARYMLAMDASGKALEKWGQDFLECAVSAIF
jgi:hypothetical protein